MTWIEVETATSEKRFINMELSKLIDIHGDCIVIKMQDDKLYKVKDMDVMLDFMGFRE